MARDFLAVLISDFRAHLWERAFLLVNLLVLFLYSLILILCWPTGIIVSFHRPFLGTAFTYALLITTVMINLFWLNRKQRFSQILTVQEWVRHSGLSPRAVVVGKLLSRCFQGFLILASSFPLGLIVFYSGGLSGSGLRLLYMLASIITCASGWTGLYLTENLTHYFYPISLSIVLIYGLGMVLTSFFPHPALPINLWFQLGVSTLSFLHLITLLLNLRGWFFR